MCCLITTLGLLGPRAGILVWWLLQPVRWQAAFSTFIWPFLGFLFVPWMTLMYVLVAPGGITGFDWIWLGIGLALDVATYGGGGYGNRQQISTYTSR